MSILATTGDENGQIFEQYYSNQWLYNGDVRLVQEIKDVFRR
jgi:hypothetical protein